MKPDFAITNIRRVGETVVAEIDTTQAQYQGRNWRSLSGYQRRKFETLVILTRPTDRVHIIYH